MPQTAAEKMRNYRARPKADSEKYQEYILKERERYRNGKAAGRSHYRPISDKTAREKRFQRKIWRQQKRILR